MNRAFLLILFIFSCQFNLIAQRSLSTKSKKAAELYYEADNFRVRGQYVQAASLLEQAIAKDKKFHEAYFRLAVIRKAKGNLEQAEQLFFKVISLNEGNNGPSYFELGELYLKQDKYLQAIENIEKYLAYNPRNKKRVEEANSILRNAQFGIENQKTISEFQPRPLNDKVNSFPMQYFPIVSVDGSYLIYTRRLGTTSEYDEDLVISRKDESGDWSTPASISENINSEFNEGTCTLSADGRTLIFTSCYGRRGFGSCDLYISEKNGGEWSNPVNLGPNVNSSSWDSQPSLSADGRTLYFISNRGGGVGRRDIWVSYKSDDNDWKKPVNMGRSINTAGDEVSPFIHPNNKVLYYSTNGLPGFGGFDIYYSNREDNWLAPINLGAPINNGQDQVSLFINSKGDKGYYSNEDNISDKKGIIYEFDLPEIHKVKYRASWIAGMVTDAESDQPLGATIELYDLERDKRVSLVKSDSVTGSYLVVLTEGSEYALYVEKPGYLFKSYTFSFELGEDIKSLSKDIPLDPIKINAHTKLNNIFFKSNEYKLEDKSKTELKKITRFIKANPNLRIEISGHTDNVGSPEYNQSLSEKRAKSVYQFLLEQGVAPTKLNTKGFGAGRPLVQNNTPENRQLNRRIEFKVVKI